MSRVGRQPIPVPDGVEVKIDGRSVSVKGPRGQLESSFDPEMEIEISDGELLVKRPTDRPRHRSLHGLTRSLLANMVEGVTAGFERTLEIHGVGYKAEKRGQGLLLQLGFSHPVEFPAPEGIDFTLDSPTLIRVGGIDKQLVGEVAARIRQIRPPEPYKGKGVRYLNEHVRRKAGKATAGGAM
jgi:large subunit ribosomal protein L6